jgi:hypothetical protein
MSECFIFSLACRCAEKAREKGYKVFGLQFYGECWGGPNGEMLFSKDGPTDTCIQQLTKPYACVKHDPFSECVGGENTNYIYRLTDNSKCTLANVSLVVVVVIAVIIVVVASLSFILFLSSFVVLLYLWLILWYCRMLSWLSLLCLWFHCAWLCLRL